MNKIYVIGSSSKISQSMEHLADVEFMPMFFGQSNPFKLKNFTQYDGVRDESSVEDLKKLIIDDMKESADLNSVSLVVLAGVSSKDWRESYLVNEYLPAVLSDEFAKYISGLDFKNCSITLVSSSAAYQGAKLPYATTKASLTGVMHSIARDYKNMIRINIILPSAFDSGMISDWDNEKRRKVADSNLIGRLGTADDMADAILFAVRNKFITNSTINMSGGTVGI